MRPNRGTYTGKQFSFHFNIICVYTIRFSFSYLIYWIVSIKRIRHQQELMLMRVNDKHMLLLSCHLDKRIYRPNKRTMPMHNMQSIDRWLRRFYEVRIQLRACVCNNAILCGANAARSSSYLALKSPGRLQKLSVFNSPHQTVKINLQCSMQRDIIYEHYLLW